MDEKLKELIAIGASVAAHCQPCLKYHVGKGKELGLTEEEIRDAVSVGRTVSKGAFSAMNSFADELLKESDTAKSACGCSSTPETCCG